MRTQTYLCAVGSLSYISILLTAYASVDSTAIQDAIRSLVQHIFSGSILFEHDPEEIHFWLSSLPIGARPFHAGSPEVTVLHNERSVVVNFLDNCVQLCLRAPYGYIEELTNSSSETTTANGYQPGGTLLSPLLATVIEQISSKITTSFSPSDTLAIVSFARRLIVRLAGKMEGLGLLVRLSENLVSLPISEILEENHVVANAVAQEITLLKNYLTLLGDPAAPMPVPESPPSPAVADFLDRVENSSLRTTLCFLYTCSADPRL
jgi:nucleolar pre-ribosomal-associated protein 1